LIPHDEIATNMTPPAYTILPIDHTFAPQGHWDSPVWRQAPALHINNFRPEGSDHRPRTEAKLLRGPAGLHGIFRVRDRYVRCVHTNFQDPVYQDSCVEFFVQPKTGGGYFNFEFNCGGAMLAFFITDPARVENGFKAFARLSAEEAELVKIFHSLPRIVEPELRDETTWLIEFFIPFALLARYAGPLGEIAGQVWRVNFYKCGDKTSHPHWASWAPVDELNFHLPRCFGDLHFQQGGG
jgi:hypothetical protein